MKALKKLIPEYARIPLVVMLLMQLLVYSGSRLITSGLYHYNLETGWDLAIPFLPWTTVIYIGSYLFWVVNVILSVRFDRDRAVHFLSADLLSKLISLVFFLCLPTTNTRPEIVGNGVFDQLMRLLYSVDPPDNLFPSLHCLLSWICCLGVYREKRIPRAYQVFSFLFTFAIFASTLTTKQHILIDVFGAWVIAAICYAICANKKIQALYVRLLRMK